MSSLNVTYNMLSQRMPMNMYTRAVEYAAINAIEKTRQLTMKMYLMNNATIATYLHNLLPPSSQLDLIYATGAQHIDSRPAALTKIWTIPANK